MLIDLSLPIDAARLTSENAHKVFIDSGHAGTHFDLVDKKFPRLVRQYSLCNSPDDRQVYRLGVLLEPTSRGGSRAMHAKPLRSRGQPGPRGARGGRHRHHAAPQHGRAPAAHGRPVRSALLRAFEQPDRLSGAALLQRSRTARTHSRRRAARHAFRSAARFAARHARHASLRVRAARFH